MNKQLQNKIDKTVDLMNDLLHNHLADLIDSDLDLFPYFVEAFSNNLQAFDVGRITKGDTATATLTKIYLESVDSEEILKHYPVFSSFQVIVLEDPSYDPTVDGWGFMVEDVKFGIKFLMNVEDVKINS